LASRKYLYAAFAAVFGAAVGLLTGRLFVVQLLALTGVVVFVAVDSLMGIDEGVEMVAGEEVLRSRVTHYAQISRVEDSARLVRTASNPFERALLHQRGWSRMSVAELRGLSERVPEESEETPAPKAAAR